ncbi:MAG: putative transrane protein [Betaproteobacteria bacterium]|nr:putative transrane protein [Betaproteobacteria bacterium]
MKRFTASVALIAAVLASGSVCADDAKARKSRSPDEFTLAVFGDWPYGKVLFDSARLLIDSINSDPEVSLTLHIGDIHAGTQPCTGAGLNPVPPGAYPSYNQQVFDLFEQFRAPFVYTPGDNEWTDCQKKKELSSGAPLNELAAVRSLFFPHAGFTLGGHKKRVSTQATEFDRRYPGDARFVENVMWEQGRIVFVTLNMPGSNNDGLAWAAPYTDETARAAEAAQRTLADLRWLDAAFDRAEEEHAKAVVIGLQADMWDPAAVVAGGDGLSNYTIFVHELAQRSARFGRPVLLINGDSHVFGADRPLADPNSATGKIHGTQAVPNLTRITVQGSTTAPAEWVRLTVDPDSPSVFSWENVPYCKDPLTSCL